MSSDPQTTPEVSLPFWMSGPELTKLAKAAKGIDPI